MECNCVLTTTPSVYSFRAETSCNIRSSFAPRIETLHGKPLPLVTTAPILVVIFMFFFFSETGRWKCEHTWALMFDILDFFAQLHHTKCVKTCSINTWQSAILCTTFTYKFHTTYWLNWFCWLWFLSYTNLLFCVDSQANTFHSLHWTSQRLCVSKRTNMNQDSWNCTCLKPWCAINSDMIQMIWNQVRIHSLLPSAW